VHRWAGRHPHHGPVQRQKSVSIIITRQPGANIVETVDALKEQIAPLQAQLPADIKLSMAMDRTITIRASLHEVEITLLISTLLVVWWSACSCRAGAPR
jgi:multidrug efflux pump